MSSLQLLGFTLGTAFASGLKLYATVAALGLMHRLDVVQLPRQLEILAHPVVLALAVGLYLVEFIADKIPLVDSAWDAIHTVIRPPAAALLSYSAFAQVPEAWQVGAALLAGGVALTAHGTKASTRAAVNTSPEPASNWTLSLAEDGIAVGLAWFAAEHPVLALVVVVGLLAISLFLLRTLFGFLRRILTRLRQGLVRSAPADAAPGSGSPPG
ncbi:MAG TPA: DUF4126 domain-containing protein [Gemmatimonadales bacterium]|nr:DUF4126 domain-containing protein [Gemmatimonadales bacterium]